MTQAIFLSYASQDADAARRICNALRAAGLEVWFDQSELRGGDAWDASIRKQIKECSLFVPVISANTNARPEGYFRLEWKLAVDRSHLMADDRAFFFPAVLDDVAEPTARVPDKFRERQWSRLNDEAATALFAERIAKLVAGSDVSSKNASNGAPTLATAQNIRHSREVTSMRGNDGVIGSVSPDATPSIAVLAFANRSASADDEYFSDGLADELLNVLAKIKGLRVAARTSAFSFKGKQTTVAEIGTILNVATVLEGSVRKSGNRVRISVQLVKVDGGFQMWGETYDRTLDDIFAVQDDIAQSVVKELRNALLCEATTSATNVAKEVAQTSLARTEKPEAQRLVLEARFYLNKRRPDDIIRGIELSQQAIDIDPLYAAAHAAMASAWHYSALYGSLRTLDATTIEFRFIKARLSAEHALRLDAMQPAPHIVLSWLACVADHDLARGMREAVAAQKLAPNDTEALRTLGHRLTEVGRFAEADAYLSQSISLDPLSVHLRVTHSLAARFAGEPQEALRRLRNAIAIDDASWIAHWHLSRVFWDLGNHAESVAALARALELRGNHEAAAHYRKHFEAGGWQGFLEGVASIPQYSPTVLFVALAQLELGRIDDAFASLNHVIDTYDPGLSWLKVDRSLHTLHDDPRFAALLKRAGFSE